MKRKFPATVKTAEPTELCGEFYDSVARVLRDARAKAHRAIDAVMVEAYWNVGRMIVKEEQQGIQRAEYGAFLIRNLSVRLTRNLGGGYSDHSTILDPREGLCD